MKSLKITSFLIWVYVLPFLFSGCGTKETSKKEKIYSRWIIESRMGDFRNKEKTSSFKTATSERNVEWDYVPGLVAKSIIMTWEQYQNEAWANAMYEAIGDYADNVPMRFGESNIDDLNAGKIFFELYRGAQTKGQNDTAEEYKSKATICRDKLVNEQIRIPDSLPGTGGFWHKKHYTNQMWLDGLFMGAAFYAEWQGNFGDEDVQNSLVWDDIALQFDTVFFYTWDAQKKLNYHAWSAEPANEASSLWADPVTGKSAEFWARGEGWFFAALVDVLGHMPLGHSARPRLENYANKVADGLMARQDAETGCWYQLLQYEGNKKGSCGKNNYLEASASSLFTYAYLKGIRLGILDKEIYTPVAHKAYKGLINEFVVEEPNGKIKLVGSCESAGLGLGRKGDADYYLCGPDVGINNDTEGKVLGPFIMASLEFEKNKTITLF